MANFIKNLLGNDSEDEEETEDRIDLSTSQVPDNNRDHRDIIAPGIFEEEKTYVKSGEKYVKVITIIGWPEDVDMTFLDNIYNINIDTDISIHVNPRDKEEAIRELETDVEKAKKQLENSVSFASQKSREKRLKTTRRTYNALKEQNQNLHEVSLYITIRSDDEDELEIATENIVRELRTNSFVPKELANQQIQGMQSTSPIMKDEVNRKKPMPSSVVGMMYPFGSSTIKERGGIDVGFHDYNGSPVTVRRFDRDNGYNQLTGGDVGTGKTFGTILDTLRFKAAYGDQLSVFLIDPLEDFNVLNELLGGEKILVGGDKKINPMNISKTPQEILEKEPQMNPYKQKKEQFMGLLDIYFSSRDQELGDSRNVAEIAIDEAYKKKGITSDPSTHDKEPPTPRDVRSILKDMENNPTDYVDVDESGNSQVISEIKEHSSRLYVGLRPFEKGGKYENLGEQGELNLEDSKTVLFDLSQKESSGGDLGLMMYLLLTQIYEESKERDDNILLNIDEAHYIMQDERSLDFLETAVRHSRHHGLGINFITQTLDEFFANEKAKAIAQQCTFKKIHKISSSIDEKVREGLQLREPHVNYIQSALSGNEGRGYSQALYSVGNYGYIPMKIRPSQFELESYNNVKEYLE